jgi:hypothetical protein
MKQDYYTITIAFFPSFERIEFRKILCDII